jgi:quercetin dioxygenase-like cupin family protein
VRAARPATRAHARRLRDLTAAAREPGAAGWRGGCHYAAGVAFRVIRPDELEWITRDHEPDEAPRHVAELSESAGFAHTRANVWRYDPGAKGRRHRHKLQEETFVVLEGTLSMYLGDPPERQDVPTGGLIHVEPGTPLQTVNHGEADLLVYAYGTPPEHEHAEILDSAV